MILIDNQRHTDPAINLACEEFALLHCDLANDHFMFYINEPSVIIGKHQNTHEEINHEYIETHGIHVVRRISGGGAVYHDYGNLNFSFITRAKNKVFNDYRTFTQPIIHALHNLGIPAELTGRNDIVVNGKKISGNAQYRRANHMFCHGTLLFNTHLDHVVAALNVNTDKIISKGIKSIRSRVANICDFLTTPLTIEDFKQVLVQSIRTNQSSIQNYQFSPDEWKAIHTLADTKYRDWRWNYGRSPEFNVQHRKRFSIGEIDVRLNVKQGIIQQVKFYGDFFAEHDIDELESILTHQHYDKTILSELLNSLELKNYFGGELSTEALIALLI